MPRLPQASDYGQRPSLQTNRVDSPDSSGLVLAEQFVRKTDEFNNQLIAKKEKKDRLNYALARNEIHQADLQIRDSLKDDPDWKSIGGKYSSKFTAARDDVLRRFQLAPDDLSIIGSESDLIQAQGGIAVGGLSRIKEIDESDARYRDGKEFAMKSLPGASQADRVGLVLGQLDVINAREEKGHVSRDDAAKERESMTQEMALRSIEAMPESEQIPLLQDTLSYRTGYGTSLGNHSESIIRASKSNNIPAELIAAQIDVESSGNPDAVNASGAQGLMQLRKDAAYDMGVTDRLDPDQNIQGGTKYLAKQLERFGDPAAALAAYNWGGTNVAKAKKEFGDDWLAHAPAETQNYVAKLLPVWQENEGKKPVNTNGKYNSGIGPLTAEDIRQGKGTGSIADFLHADTAAKMLDSAISVDKENLKRIEAHDVATRAQTLYPENFSEQQKYIANNSQGSVRDQADQYARQAENDVVTSKNKRSADVYEETYRSMEEDPSFYFESVPADELKDLNSVHYNALKEASIRKQYDKQWPDVTTFIDPGDGSMSVEEWNRMQPYGQGGKVEQDIYQPWFRNAFAEKEWNDVESEWLALKASEKTPVYDGGKAPHLMVNEVLVANGFMGKNGQSPEQQQVAAALSLRLQAEIVREQNKHTPPIKLDPESKNRILVGLLKEEAWVEDAGRMWFDKKIPIYKMTVQQKNDAYIPLEIINEKQTSITGSPLTVYNYLLQLAKTKVEMGGAGMTGKVNDFDIQRAAFAMENGMDNSEILRRLKGE